MKQIQIIIIILFNTSFIFSQKPDLLIYNFNFEEKINCFERNQIIGKGVSEYCDYLEMDKGFANPVGYIIKFIKIDEDSLVFSMSYFNNFYNLENYGPFLNETEVNFKPLLIYSQKSNLERYLTEMECIGIRKIADNYIKKIKFEKGVSLDVYLEAVFKYSNNKLVMYIYPDYLTPIDLKPQNEKSINRMKKVIKHINKNLNK